MSTGAVKEMFGVPEPIVGTSWNVFVSPLALSIATAVAAIVALPTVDQLVTSFQPLVALLLLVPSQ